MTRWSAPPSTSWATVSPSKTPIARVSAPVSAGDEVVADTRMRPASIRHYHGPPFPTPPRRTRPMPQTVILGAARTPIGKLGGGLASIDATELGGIAIKAALDRADVAPDQIQHVIMGQV